ncbi:MAG: transporter substrate-binding domain-containing protein [Rhodospirillales bacterium]|nr:transporter substrate-binding domain-containing protein [Rhodospirillales bacterium]
MPRRLPALGLLLSSLWAGSALAQVPSNSVLAKVKNEGTLKVCFAQTTPDAFKEPKTGKWTGVMVDLANELADWMKVKIEPVEVQFATVILALNRGDCDLFGASLLYNAPRAMEIDYITPFAAKGMNAVIKADNRKHFTKPEDFNQDGVTLAAVAGSRDYEVAKRIFPKAKLIALNTQTDIQLFETVRRGDADAAFGNGITIRWWLKSPDQKWATVAFKDDFSTQPNGWAIRYGDPAWKDFLDSYAQWALANNRARDLYESYLNRDSQTAK